MGSRRRTDVYGSVNGCRQRLMRKSRGWRVWIYSQRVPGWLSPNPFTPEIERRGRQNPSLNFLSLLWLLIVCYRLCPPNHNKEEIRVIGLITDNKSLTVRSVHFYLQNRNQEVFRSIVILFFVSLFKPLETCPNESSKNSPTVLINSVKNQYKTVCT